MPLRGTTKTVPGAIRIRTAERNPTATFEGAPTCATTGHGRLPRRALHGTSRTLRPRTLFQTQDGETPDGKDSPMRMREVPCDRQRRAEERHHMPLRGMPTALWRSLDLQCLLSAVGRPPGRAVQGL